MTTPTTSYNPSAVVTRRPDTGDWDYDLYPTKEAADRGRYRCRPDLNPRVVPTSHAKDAAGKILLIGTGDVFHVEEVKDDDHHRGGLLLIGRTWHDDEADVEAGTVGWSPGRRSTYTTLARSVYPVMPDPVEEAATAALIAADVELIGKVDPDDHETPLLRIALPTPERFGVAGIPSPITGVNVYGNHFRIVTEAGEEPERFGNAAALGGSTEARVMAVWRRRWAGVA